MELNEIAETAYYNSTYRHGVDEKRRVQIPAKWRPAKAGMEFTVMLWPKELNGPCLRVLTPQKMADLMRDLDAMPNSDPKKGVLKRRIGSESFQVAPDKTGRVCLEAPIAEAAGIKANGEVVLVGLLDRFEMWNPERYEKVKASDAAVAREAFNLME